jgi:hypothetical protein
MSEDPDALPSEINARPPLAVRLKLPVSLRVQPGFQPLRTMRDGKLRADQAILQPRQLPEKVKPRVALLAKLPHSLAGSKPSRLCVSIAGRQVAVPGVYAP